MSTTSYLVIITVYLLCGASVYTGASRWLSRRVTRQTARRISLMFSLVLTLSGLLLMTWAYLYM